MAKKYLIETFGCQMNVHDSERMAGLLDQAGQTADENERNALLRKADAILYEEAPVWFFNYNKAVMAYQPWIHGLQANATELTHQYPEYIWVDEKSPAK